MKNQIIITLSMINFFIIVSVLLLDSCLIIPRHRTHMERRLYRSGLYIHPRIQLYKRKIKPTVPSYLPQFNKNINLAPQKPR